MKHKMTGFRILLCLLAVFVALSFAAPSVYAEETPVPDGSSQEGTMPPADPAGEPAGEPAAPEKKTSKTTAKKTGEKKTAAKKPAAKKTTTKKVKEDAK